MNFRPVVASELMQIYWDNCEKFFYADKEASPQKLANEKFC